MFFGSTRYSEIQKHIPNISPSLLRNRLRFLEEQGVVMRKRVGSGNRYEYHLTASGKSLAPVLTEMGKWGMCWVSKGMTDKQNTASGLVRDFASGIRVEELPSCDTVIRIMLKDDEESATSYIHVQDGQIQVCDTGLGFDVDIYINSTLTVMTQIWYGEKTVADAIKKGELTVMGLPLYCRSISRWLGISSFTTDSPGFGPARPGK